MSFPAELDVVVGVVAAATGALLAVARRGARVRRARSLSVMLVALGLLLIDTGVMVQTDSRNAKTTLFALAALLFLATVASAVFAMAAIGREGTLGNRRP